MTCNQIHANLPHYVLFRGPEFGASLLFSSTLVRAPRTVGEVFIDADYHCGQNVYQRTEIYCGWGGFGNADTLL